ncbi:hypothetical protein MOQ72_14840 [Saccharopolyspora sp. K220]|uniref:hypothetical protein n=1 Tax=Saccharopolyspora soli TaxID=2926618 RepID=UPI001F584399|nr:hypothetical protein [Saccharopolyspora soli]MCI2418715.1 hypothetical protein [Saccharopolyspora soli]
MRGPVQYLGASGLAGRLGVSRSAVTKWRERYGPDSAHPFPVPDVEVDGVPGWRPTRVSEVEYWRAGLPGRGAGGGRPPAAEREYLRVAESRGVSRDEARRLADAVVAEHPEMSQPEIYAWLVALWRED